MTARLPIILDANTRTVSPHPPDTVPALIAAAGERAARRFLEFFAANIRNHERSIECGPTGPDRDALATDYHHTHKLAGVPPGSILRLRR